MSKRGRDILWVASSNVDPDFNTLYAFLFGAPEGTNMPTEKEVRDAVMRLLRHPDCMGEGQKLIGLLFSPLKPSSRSYGTLHTINGFKKTSTKSPDIQRNITIAWEVENARARVSYERAVAEVAERRGLSERQVGRIYGKIHGKP